MLMEVSSDMFLLLLTRSIRKMKVEKEHLKRFFSFFSSGIDESVFLFEILLLSTLLSGLDFIIFEYKKMKEWIWL